MKNKYIIEGNQVRIFLHRRDGRSDLETIIDLDDFDKINAFKGSFYASLNRSIGQYYAKITIHLGLISGKFKNIVPVLSRIILDCNDWNYEVDHINNDTLDNRKENLRIVSIQNNSMNRRNCNSNNTSGYRNVSFYNGFYIVQIQVNGNNKLMGKFKDVHDAGMFAEEMRKKYYKEFA